MTVLTLNGELDGLTAPLLRRRVQELTRADRHHLVIDLDRVSFIDSPGLGTLIAVRKLLRAHHGTLRLAAAQDKHLRLFRLTGLHDVLEIHSSTDAAVQAAAPTPPAI